MVPSRITSRTSTKVLTEIYGLPWDEPVVQAYVSTVRPSMVRVIEDGGMIRCNAVPWRVTVCLTALRRVKEITQECVVELPADGSCRHAHELGLARDRLRARYGPRWPQQIADARRDELEGAIADAEAVETGRMTTTRTVTEVLRAKLNSPDPEEEHP